ncbi:MAG: hypothetical protein CSA52_02020 [Gammaproteobacteria bacterium]|nr:MAG: hypothetical protein CSB48_07520 [Pseudomonadota bacterium]PIE38530.1 MAG: hypothetical protein CSA52_02020 [Gammaproteobacteria bacterium]
MTKPERNEIKMINAVFIDRNRLTLFLSGALMIIAMLWQPIVISVTRLLLTGIASTTYVVATWLFIKKKRDITDLA